MATRQYYQVASDGESSTSNNSTFQDKATLTFTPDASSTYLIISTWLVKGASTTYDALSRLYDSTGSATLCDTIFRGVDTTDYYPGGCAIVASFGESPSEQTYKVQYRVETSSNSTTYIKFARIIAIKLVTGDVYASSTDRSTYNTNTAWQDKVTKTWTPAAGDYLILASAVYDGSSLERDSKARIDVDGSAQYGTINVEATSNTNRVSYLYFQKVTLTAAEHTIKIQYATEATDNAVGIAYAYLTILKLSEVPALGTNGGMRMS